MIQWKPLFIRPVGQMARYCATLVLLTCHVLTAPAKAQITEEAGPEASQFHWQAFVDSYYAWDFNQPADQNRTYTTQPLRHSDFNLNLGLLEARYQSAGLRGRLGLQTGTYVQSNLATEPALLQPVYAASAGVQLQEGLWLDAGIFPSHIGFEGILSADITGAIPVLWSRTIPLIMKAAFGSRDSGAIGKEHCSYSMAGRIFKTIIQTRRWGLSSAGRSIKIYS